MEKLKHMRISVVVNVNGYDYPIRYICFLATYYTNKKLFTYKYVGVLIIKSLTSVFVYVRRENCYKNPKLTARMHVLVHSLMCLPSSSVLICLYFQNRIFFLHYYMVADAVYAMRRGGVW